jgi:hypothetical protein
LIAIEMRHREELGRLTMQLLLYRKALADNGIELPDSDGEDLEALWSSCKNVVRAASQLVATLGTSAELLQESWR